MAVDMNSLVLEWLKQGEILSEVVELSEEDKKDTDFVYRFKTASLEHAVIKPKGEDRIIFASGLELSETHAKMIKEMSEHDRREFLWNLRKEFFWKPIRISIPQTLDSIEFQGRIYSDGLSRDHFMRMVDQLYDSFRFVTGSLQREAALRGIKEVEEAAEKEKPKVGS